MKNSEIFKKWSCIIQGHKYERTTGMTVLCTECGVDRPESIWKPAPGDNKLRVVPSNDSGGKYVHYVQRKK